MEGQKNQVLNECETTFLLRHCAPLAPAVQYAEVNAADLQHGQRPMQGVGGPAWRGARCHHGSARGALAVRPRKVPTREATDDAVEWHLHGALASMSRARCNSFGQVADIAKRARRGVGRQLLLQRRPQARQRCGDRGTGAWREQEGDNTREEEGNTEGMGGVEGGGPDGGRGRRRVFGSGEERGG